MLSQQRAVHEYDRAGGKYTRDKPSLFVPYQHYSPAPSFILVLLRLLLSFLLLFSFYTTVHLLSLALFFSFHTPPSSFSFPPHFFRSYSFHFLYFFSSSHTLLLCSLVFYPYYLFSFLRTSNIFI